MKEFLKQLFQALRESLVRYKVLCVVCALLLLVVLLVALWNNHALGA